GGSGQMNFSSEYFKGNLFMLGAAVAWVIYSLITRPLGKRYSRLAITTYQTVFGTLAIVPFVLFETNRWPMVNGVIISNIVFLGVFCSALCYYGYIYTIGELGVDIASLFINFIPVVTVISSYLILGEKITPAQMVGGGVILSAVYLADWNNWSAGFIKERPAGETGRDETKDVT
ncbi:MAG: DMT family transporter, partial [Eubacteriales bacterium]